jgi:hypothetical protein
MVGGVWKKKMTPPTRGVALAIERSGDAMGQLQTLQQTGRAPLAWKEPAQLAWHVGTEEEKAACLATDDMSSLLRRRLLLLLRPVFVASEALWIGFLRLVSSTAFPAPLKILDQTLSSSSSSLHMWAQMPAARLGEVRRGGGEGGRNAAQRASVQDEK